MIQLICIDVDGTLVGASGIVADEVWDAVDAALDRGQHLALSTARGAFAASWEMAKRLDPSGWHVFHAGGATVHTGTGDTRQHTLTDEQVSTAMSVAEIAETTGFATPGHFSNAFKDTFGIRPQADRKNQAASAVSP